VAGTQSDAHAMGVPVETEARIGGYRSPTTFNSIEDGCMSRINESRIDWHIAKRQLEGFEICQIALSLRARQTSSRTVLVVRPTDAKSCDSGNPPDHHPL